MHKLVIEFSDEEYAALHEEAQQLGIEDSEHVRREALRRVQRQPRTDEEIGEYLRRKNFELYRRLS